MTAITPTVLLAFLDQVEGQRQPMGAVQPWLRDRVLARDKSRCWHCRAPAARVVPLLSRALGGSAGDANLVACCDRCRVEHANSDPLAGPWARDKRLTLPKAARRGAALNDATHHPVADCYRRSTAACRDWLKGTRWTFPRVPVAVLCGPAETCVCPVQVSPGLPWGAMAASLRQAGALSVALAPHVLILPSERWPMVAQALIERHAILRRVSVQGAAGWEEQEHGLGEEPRPTAGWDLLFSGIEQTRRGREAKPRAGFRPQHARA